MKILDWYILKRYLVTFLLMLLLFIPIAIIVDLADRIDNILENNVAFIDVAGYYLDFTIYFANLLFPLFLFISVIWFTSKLANNTEVIAFLSSGVSFSRFLRPYIIGAIIIAVFAFILGVFLAPKASKGFNEFKYEHLNKNRKDRETQNIYRQINEHDYIYVSQFVASSGTGLKFRLEHVVDNTLQFKITAETIKFVEKDSVFKLGDYTKRIIGENNDIIINKRVFDTIFPFELEDLTPVEYIAEILEYNELTEFIEKEEFRGTSNVGRYKVVLYKKWSLPISIFILTIIAVAVSSIKRRGGMGVNLVFGVSIALVYVFFDKIFGVMAQQSDFPPIIAVWLPNVVFAILAIYLLYNAKR
ncbi:LptF/LptG family permease [Flavobacteriaceae bacterium AU392]|nr:YjgP/YjgQ family permease [Flavobacteriaceae bacterium]RKM86838.1 LptF/LptG family permease [Flavobacteriaceae bacterium AU392]